MAARVVFFAFILCILSVSCQAHLISLSNVNHLEGSHNGETANGLNQVKHYLIQLGYLTYANIHGEDDYFDDELESAIKTYQQYYHLNVSGILDKETIKAMAEPRCGGMPDITPSLLNHNDNISDCHINARSYFNFFPDAPRWPAFKSHLTYYIHPPSPYFKIKLNDFKDVLRIAFSNWSDATKGFLTFEEVEEFNVADIKITVRSMPDQSGILGWGEPPTAGYAVFNEFVPWAIGPHPSSYDVATVARYVIGNLLGLGGSKVMDAVMYPITPINTSKQLGEDDILGIRVLYNIH